jgi:tetratricopeptide (TPR) repeat protein
MEKFSKAIEIDDTKAEYYTNKALANFHLGDYREAENLCQKAQSLKADSARNFHTMGII